MSLSLLLIAKGVAVLWKTHAAHAALMKAGAYLLTTKGVVATASTTALVATAAGVYSVANSALEYAVSGFSKIKEGLNESEPSKILDGIFELRRAYNSAEDLLSDFDSFIDQTESNYSVRTAYKEGIKEFKSYIQAEIEDNCVILLSEVENFLKCRNTTLQEYEDEINSIYHSYMDGCSRESYSYLLGQAGKVYDKIVRYNLYLGLWPDYYRYDHYLAYCIAGWIKDNLWNNTADNKTQKEVAADITNNIFKYINGE